MTKVSQQEMKQSLELIRAELKSTKDKRAKASLEILRDVLIHAIERSRFEEIDEEEVPSIREVRGTIDQFRDLVGASKRDVFKWYQFLKKFLAWVKRMSEAKRARRNARHQRALNERSKS